MKKYYTFAMVLYKDSTSYDYNKVINYIEKNYKYYAYIEHNEDIDDKKEHTHVLMHFDNKRYNTGISKELNVPSNYIVHANLIPYLRYLIHFDDEDKKQYSIEEVHGPLSNKLKDIISKDKKTESEQVAEIMSYIFESNEFLYVTNVAQFVLNNGCYSAFRRNYLFFKDLVLEHNRNI